VGIYDACPTDPNPSPNPNRTLCTTMQHVIVLVVVVNLFADFYCEWIEHLFM